MSNGSTGPGGATVAPLTELQKILASIQLVTQTGTQIASIFGHPTLASAFNEIPQLAAVGIGLFQAIEGLFKHPAIQAALPAPTTQTA